MKISKLLSNIVYWAILIVLIALIIYVVIIIIGSIGLKNALDNMALII